MMGKVEMNKDHKENALLDAAFDLFTKDDVNSPTIDEIVKKAGVAKGTFYLYFKNKYDLLEGIVVRKASALLTDALLATRMHHFESRIDKVSFFVGDLIDKLSQDKLLTRIIYKNLSLSLYHKVLDDPARGKELREIVNDFKSNILGQDFSFEETDRLLFIIIEMTGATCYSAILFNEPAPMDEMKPVLIKAIRKIIL